ncbi:MAG TPA: hypothetical protein VK614_04775 [Allosphingosinicella sp.]|nr:hypothetical protein [Allosphingosinicella sp.]
MTTTSIATPSQRTRPGVANNFDLIRLVAAVEVFHMPTINAMLHLRIGNAAIAMAMTLVLAILSWRFVEQHALRVRK